jgi:hypothetical protein
MAKRTLPSQDYLRQCFDYDPGTGILTWRERPREHFPTYAGMVASNARFAGKVCGSSENKGYKVVGISGSLWPLHRLIWKMVTGEDPDIIDHIDRDRANNRWVNLRSVTEQQNHFNLPRYSNNRSGFKGVHRHSQNPKWIAQIRVDGRVKHIGSFNTIEAAKAAYNEAADRLHGEFASY